MDLVITLQSLATPFLSVLAELFEFLGSPEFFLFVFAIVFLVIEKKLAYKQLVSYFLGFSLGSIAIKNIVKRPRPYQLESSLLSSRNSYSYALPSQSVINSTINSYTLMTAFYSSLKRNKEKSKFFNLLLVVLLFYCCGVGFAKIYFADNYLFDVIVGLFIGFLISSIVFKYVKVNIKSKEILGCVGGVFCLGLILFYGKDLISNNFDNIAIFEFAGIILSCLIGDLIEEKYIKYEIKNNLLLIILKIATLVIIFLGYHFLGLILPGLVIVVFLKYFIFGLIATTLLPMLFKYIQKFCYVFSNNVDNKRVVLSSVSLSENGTRKIAKKIKKYINKGDIILLQGDMGAGKSFLTRSLLNVYGINKRITSPTFTLYNDYSNNFCHFYHFDMYRLEGEDEVANIGFDEILDDKDSIKFIEWPDKAEKYLPKHYKKITIVKLGKKSRNIILEDYSF